MLQANLNRRSIGQNEITTSNSSLKPQAYIAVNKNRVKRYNAKSKTFSENECNVYLSDNTEFQIEIFNPTQDVYLAKIKMNGKYISNSGIVVNPGQRIFLDRFIDQNSKFLFKTYEVSGTNEEVKRAIEKNGLVEIEFYKENEPYRVTWFYDWPQYYDSYNKQAFPAVINTMPKTFTDTQIYGLMNNMTQQTCYNGIRQLDSAEIETGRIERGNASDQSFTKINKDFSYFSSNIEIIKILPESQKVYTNKDLLKHRKYCSNCGKKVNPKDKFCSNCGKKL